MISVKKFCLSLDLFSNKSSATDMNKVKIFNPVVTEKKLSFSDYKSVFFISPSAEGRKSQKIQANSTACSGQKKLSSRGLNFVSFSQVEVIFQITITKN